MRRVCTTTSGTPAPASSAAGLARGGHVLLEWRACRNAPSLARTLTSHAAHPPCPSAAESPAEESPTRHPRFFAGNSLQTPRQRWTRRPRCANLEGQRRHSRDRRRARRLLEGWWNCTNFNLQILLPKASNSHPCPGRGAQTTLRLVAACARALSQKFFASAFPAKLHSLFRHAAARSPPLRVCVVVAPSITPQRIASFGSMTMMLAHQREILPRR